jgi:imidazoleglycerol-phosphate dehydratase/histidinol-phosphatase
MKKIVFVFCIGAILKRKELINLDVQRSLNFVSKVVNALYKIQNELGFELVLISATTDLINYDYIEISDIHLFITEFLANEDVFFSEVIALQKNKFSLANADLFPSCVIKKYTSNQYDLKNSIVVGDSQFVLDVADALNTDAILLNPNTNQTVKNNNNFSNITKTVNSWPEIYEYAKNLSRRASVTRKTQETNISVEIDLEGNGSHEIKTGIGFFDHMLEQLAKHSGISLFISAVGDIRVDEHHLVEDIAIVLGDSLRVSLGKKIGIQRFGFHLPMDDSQAHVLIDLCGRSWLEWDVNFKREKIGEMPTELFKHFFKSLTDTAKMNLHIKAIGENDHHLIESIFKSFAKALQSAIIKNASNLIPSTKGVL